MRTLRFALWSVTAVTAAALCLPEPCAAGWPMWRGDAARSGSCADPLAPPLKPAWVHRPASPQPAWPASRRLRDDWVFQVVVADGDKVLYGSSADHAVHCLSAVTGRERWAFVTDAPIRYAPAVWQGTAGGAKVPASRAASRGAEPTRVLVASDDGCLYCLRAADGALLWRHRAGAARQMVLGNRQLVSRWCARGGPVIVGRRVYYGAGIWPSEGVYITALDVLSGKVVWSADKLGGLYMPQPHGGANAFSGLIAQGHLAADGDDLVVPTGRAVPAVLARADGSLRYFHLQQYGHNGGSVAALVGPWLLNGLVAYDRGSGHAVRKGVPSYAAAQWGRTLVYYGKGRLYGLALDPAKPAPPADPVQKRRAAPNATPARVKPWFAPVVAGGLALIVAGDVAVSAGPGALVLVDLQARKSVWATKVPGDPLGLAAANGRLYVSTTTGEIHCFVSADQAAQGKPRPGGSATAADPATPSAAPKAPRPSPGFDRAAQAILAQAGPSDGYCVDLDCRTGELAHALALRSKWHIYALAREGGDAAAARKRLRAAGLYGTRVTVHQGDPANSPYPDYFADVAVSAASLSGKGGPAVLAEMKRLVRPGGGLVLTGRADSLAAWRRPLLSGEGQWTHQYHDPGNTACGTDQLVRGPLRMLWFGSDDLHLPNRHGRGPAPLYANGRLFTEGLDALRAISAYNGRTLWSHPLNQFLRPYHQEHLMGTAGTGSNFCLGPRSVFIHTGATCVRLDQATGKQTASYQAPKPDADMPGRWGYLAWSGGTLFASLADTTHLVPYRFGRSDMEGMYTESRALLALDPDSGAERWRYSAAESIRHNAIAIGGGRVFLIDRVQARETPGSRRLATPQPTGTLLALDAKTGKVLWRTDKDVYGTVLILSLDHDALLMTYQSTRFRLNSEVGGRMTAHRASTGKRLWSAEMTYASRPVVVGRTIYAQPSAWDLLTGKQRMTGESGGQPRAWRFARSYGCGILSASPHMLLFRSATLGYRDLSAERPTANYGGVRPGCWINTIPAGGLVLMPDATTICRCSYLNRCTVALQPAGAWPPVLRPGAGAYPPPLRIAIAAPGQGRHIEIRYTTDGTPPTATSARYKAPIAIETPTTVSAGLFRDGHALSEVVSARYAIDRTRIPLDEECWHVRDAPGAVSGPSRWVQAGEVVSESSNIYTGSAGAARPERPRYGSLRIYRGGKAFADGVLTLQIRSRDDDMIGVAFRLQDAENHYLWAMDRQRNQHVLACRQGDKYTVLAHNTKGYTTGRWHEVRIVLAGRSIEVWLDGKLDLKAEDKTFPSGTVALHHWGNSGSEFRRIRWTPAEK